MDLVEKSFMCNGETNNTEHYSLLQHFIIKLSNQTYDDGIFLLGSYIPT